MRPARPMIEAGQREAGSLRVLLDLPRSLSMHGPGSARKMSFNPYDEWLGIPPDRQPPTPAGLLGLPEDEADVDRIREAASRRYEHVKKYTLTGPLSAHANRLLDEISQALKSLTDPGRIEWWLCGGDRRGCAADGHGE